MSILSTDSYDRRNVKCITPPLDPPKANPFLAILQHRYHNKEIEAQSAASSLATMRRTRAVGLLPLQRWWRQTRLDHTPSEHILKTSAINEQLDRARLGFRKYLGIVFDRFYSLSSNQALQHFLKQAHVPWQAQFLATESFQYLKTFLNSSCLRFHTHLIPIVNIRSTC